MWTFLLRRALLSVPTLLVVTILVFLMIHLAPGSPAELMLGPFTSEEQIARLNQSLGLDQPIVVQYGRWLARAATGDLGHSFSLRLPVAEELIKKFQATLYLTVAAIFLSSVLGIFAGIIAASFRKTIIDRGIMVFALFGLSLPVFWLGMLLIIVFSVELRWFPIGGMLPGSGEAGVAQYLRHLFLPAFTLGTANAGYIARFTRSSLIEVLGADYIRTAKAKGRSSTAIIFGHALRNVMIKVVTVQGLQFGYLLGGAVLTETVFNWPGLGTLVLRAILSRDFPVIQGAVLLIAVSFIIVNLIVDIVYALIDPRVSY